MDRRDFLKASAAAWVALQSGTPLAIAATGNATAPQFHTNNLHWQLAYDAALAVLAGNVRVLPGLGKPVLPVLIEGSAYNGIWMECGPHEALVYRRFRPDVARNSHLLFFASQRPDGQLPYANRRSSYGFGQIQMVVPIAATAWELAQATGDDELLHAAYKACSAWDGWLAMYRNTRGTGLTEGFCTYDTGNDNSPRWHGIPNACPGGNAKKCPPLPTLPRLCPDLSATTYGARVSLAAMASALGKNAEAEQWITKAEQIQKLILSKLYRTDDAAFYDLDAQNHFIRIRSEIITRVCGEHVPDQKLFDELWTRQIHNPHAFWPAFPLPSISVDDPTFVRPIPRNSWGGAAQALTALRAGRWLEHYGRAAEFSHMMDRWCEAIQRDPTFRQQIDPLDGAFTQDDLPNYSPCALVMLDTTWRLAGIVEQPDALHWNVRRGHPAAASAKFQMQTDAGPTAVMQYDDTGAELLLARKSVARITGGTARLITNKTGMPQAILGISEQPQKVSLQLPGQKRRQVNVKSNQRMTL